MFMPSIVTYLLHSLIPLVFCLVTIIFYTRKPFTYKNRHTMIFISSLSYSEGVLDVLYSVQGGHLFPFLRRNTHIPPELHSTHDPDITLRVCHSPDLAHFPHYPGHWYRFHFLAGLGCNSSVHWAGGYLYLGRVRGEWVYSFPVRLEPMDWTVLVRTVFRTLWDDSGLPEEVSEMAFDYPSLPQNERES